MPVWFLSSPPDRRPPALPRTERIVVDWHTGLAIAGYDPVAFFTDGKPMAGSADFELRYGGAVWRFANVGNRAAFAAQPDVYMPQYGGYDPVGVARGVAVAGNPNVWLIAGEKLFLFFDNGRRAEIRRRSGARDRLGRPQMAGSAEHAHAVSRRRRRRKPESAVPRCHSAAAIRRAR